ncbi:hypothetical protein LL06_19400 [Hoeflea sp. BAL378]|uniref:alpha/beta hydrolase family protein n=1 Tax=Hoeflea sp. BAL378 TaxID=1547437 RepID=UPI000513E040|nr:hypothetical protein [Hoeflea sp. BAL378]KGF67940.1 hypothetical protein LL06_19400 [Hoeflea sp. BAL378]
MTPPRYASAAAPGKLLARADIAIDGVTGAPLPLVCRWPEDNPPRGVVVFCHGLSASGRDYAGLSGHWAAHGYLVIHPTFPDWIGAVAAAEPELGLDPAGDLGAWASNETVRARMFEILHAPWYGLERIRIVGQVMNRLDGIVAATSGPVGATVSCAIAGHSFGAYTSQLLAGAVIDLPGQGTRSFRDDRFAAAILLSAQGRDQQGLREGSWDGISGPMLNVTGTRDGGAKGQDWRWKVEPYELAPPGDKYLALLTGADHYLGGIARPDQSPQPDHLAAVEQVTLAFLDVYLGKDAAAKAWLAGLSDRIGGCEGLFRRK